MARTPRTRAARSEAEGDEGLPGDGDGQTSSRTQDQRGRTGRMVADPPGLELGSESAIDAAIRVGESTARGQTDDTGDTVEHGESVEDLRRQLRREKQAREAAETRAADQEGRAADALDGQSVAHLNTLKTAKTQLEGEQAALRGQLSAAHADGDFDAVANINQAMTEAAVRKQNIENGILALENQPKQREALARRGESGDMKFQQITKGMAPVAKQWFRDNPEYYQDQRKLNRLIAAEQLVMNDDDPPEINTDEYFERVEEELGRRDPKFAGDGRSQASGDDDRDRGRDMRRQQDDDDDGTAGTAGRGQRRQADRPSGGAPVTRGSRGGVDTNPTRGVRASAAQIEAAEIANIPIEEYMNNVRDLEKQDRVGRNARNRNQMH